MYGKLPKRAKGCTIPIPADSILQQQLGMLAEYLPRSVHGSTLITTRDGRVGERFAERDELLVIQSLEVVDATSMLRSRLPSHLDWVAAEVAELLECLQYLPLAITEVFVPIDHREAKRPLSKAVGSTSLDSSF
jgi:hypothetical protein